MSKGINVTGYPARRQNYAVAAKPSQITATHHTNQREMAAKRNGTAKGLSKPKYTGASVYKHEEDKYEVPSFGGRSKGTVIIQNTQSGYFQLAFATLHFGSYLC